MTDLNSKSQKHACLVNYNHDPQDWWLTYGIKPENTTLYDRSDDGVERIFAAKTYRTENRGDVDADKLAYLIENYDSLPEVFLWGKTNIFKYVDEESLKDAIKTAQFAPLLKADHKTYSDHMGQVCFYSGGIYHERNDSWYFNAGLQTRFAYTSWSEWSRDFHLPNESYIPFPPGGNFLLTKERVHRYSRDFYERMRETMLYAKHPIEAHLAERSYYYLWR